MVFCNHFNKLVNCGFKKCSTFNWNLYGQFRNMLTGYKPPQGSCEVTQTIYDLFRRLVCISTYYFCIMFSSVSSVYIPLYLVCTYLCFQSVHNSVSSLYKTLYHVCAYTCIQSVVTSVSSLYIPLYLVCTYLCFLSVHTSVSSVYMPLYLVCT